MASPLLLLGLIVILAVAIIAFALVLTPSVSGGMGPPQLQATATRRAVRVALLSCGATSSLALTHLHTFSNDVYRPRYFCGIRREALHVNKVVTACFLACVAVLFSRPYVPTWIGLSWASPATGVCSSPELKWALFTSQILAETRLNESEVQAAGAAAAFASLQAAVADPAVFVPPATYPGACTNASSFVIAQGLTRTCTATFSFDGGAAAGFLNFWSGDYDNSIHVNVPYACPNPGGVASGSQHASAQSSFQSSQMAKAHGTPVNVSSPSATVSQAVGTLVDTLLYQTDVASNLYFAYQCLCLCFTTPLAVYGSSALTRLRRASCRISQPAFIAIFLAVWWGHAYAAPFFSSLDISAYFCALRVDPCFIAPAFVLPRAAYVYETCRQLEAAQANYSSSVGGISDLLAGLSFCGDQCSAGGGAYCTTPGWPALYAAAVRANATWGVPLAGGGRCDTLGEMTGAFSCDA